MPPTIQSVTGTLTHGSLLTIASTATDFGAHADWNNTGSLTWKGRDFLCKAFKDVEDGTLESDGFSETAGNPENFAIVTTPVRTNRTYSVRRYWNDANTGALGLSQGADHTEWYANWWMRWNNVSTNVKSFRLWSDGTNDVTLFCHGPGNDWTATDGINENGGLGIGPTADTWHHMEAYMRAVSTSDHGLQVWQDAVLAISVVNQSGIYPQLQPYNDGGHTWDLIDYFDGFNGSTYWNDLYLDHTRARVEIGNAATRATCTQIEIQIPVTWTTSQITISVNQGAFASNASVWLYVVDSSGVVSADGEPIQFGQTYGGSQRIISHTYNITRPQHFRKIHPKI